MQIHEKHKLMMGKLFYIMRKEKRLVRKNLLFKDNIAICSSSTYQRIENGEIILQDEIYERLLENFHLKYKIITNIDLYINQLVNVLFDACYFQNEKGLEQLYKDFIQRMFSYKKNFIYEEYYELIEMIFNFYLYSKYVDLDKYEHLYNCLIKEVYTEKWNILVLEILSITCINSFGQSDKRLIELRNRYKSHPIIQYCCYPDLFDERQYYEALGILDKAYKQVEKDKNTFRMMKCRIAKFNIVKAIDIPRALEMSEEINEMFRLNSYPNDLISTWYYNLAILYLNRDGFEECIEYMRKVLKYKEFLSPYIFICTCQSKLGSSLYEVNEEVLQRYQDDPRIVYLKIFEMRNKKISDKEIEEYLLKDAQKFLQTMPRDAFFWEIADDEFSKCVQNTKDYGLYFKFRNLSAKAV